MKIFGQLAWLLGGLLTVSSAYAAESLATVQQRAESRGYRVREVRWDPVLQQRWAVLESVANPQLPLLAELTDSGEDLPASAAAAGNIAPTFKVTEPAVRSGERVILWSAEQNVRMQMGAIAEGNAAVGQQIQVRVTGAGVNGDAGWRATGTVRGPGSVEIER